MTKVFFDTAVSLDGFMAGENRGPANPLGDRGTSIHDWMFKQKAFLEQHGMGGGTESGRENELIRESIGRTGACIMGKRMFEEGEPNWPEDLFKTDVYVLTREKRDPWIQKGSTVFYFTDESPDTVLEKAKKSAGEKDVRIQGGAQTIQQFLNAGLVDEGLVHISPVVLGKGIRLFDNLYRDRFEPEIAEIISSGHVTHIRYIFIRKSSTGTRNCQ
jgi:dihydrofolate reductase